MSEMITLELPSDLLQRARVVAASTHRRLEDAVAEWIARAVAEPSVEELSDEEIQSLCDAELPAPLQAELSHLLEANQEGALDAVQRARFNEVMHAYRVGIVRKARAMKEAVARGLRPRIDGHAA